MLEDNDPVQGATPLDEVEMSEAEIDKNLQDSFPASDPPSWTLGVDHRKEPPKRNKKDEDDHSEQ
jgi:hypothetical protein